MPGLLEDESSLSGIDSRNQREGLGVADSGEQVIQASAADDDVGGLVLESRPMSILESVEGKPTGCAIKDRSNGGLNILVVYLLVGGFRSLRHFLALNPESLPAVGRQEAIRITCSLYHSGRDPSLHGSVGRRV